MEGLEVHERGQTLNQNDASFVPAGPTAYADKEPLPVDQEHFSKRSHHIPCGLSPLVFAIVVASLTMIVVGAAVGGGLGASLAAARQRTSSSACSSILIPTTSTAAAAPTAATGTSLKNYTVADPKQVADVALDCPHRNGEKYLTVRGQVYTITCWQGYLDYDLASITAYTLDACIEACSSMNHFEYPRNGNRTLCSMVSFGTTMSVSDNLRQYANCWLKNGTSQVVGSLAGFATARLDSGAGQ